jgi:opacity protein-like surface antigen
MKSKIIVMLALVGSCEAALADEPGFYAYGSLGSALTHIDQAKADALVSAANGNTRVTSSDHGNPFFYRVVAGYQVLWNLGVELGCAGTNSFRYSTSAPPGSAVSRRLQVLDVAVALSYPLRPGLDLVGRLGAAARVHATGLDTITPGTSTHFSATKTSGAEFGVGLKYAISPHLSVRVDWTGFDTPRKFQITSAVSALTAGIGYHF